MKKVLSFVMSFFVLCSFISCADDKPVPYEKLPAAAKTLVAEHFADRTVALVKMDAEVFSKSYELVFTNGEKIDFDGKGRWKDIDCSASFVPEALVPAAIADYVKTNYPGLKIMKIEKDDRGWEVELTNRLELKFNKNYKLVKVDL